MPTPNDPAVPLVPGTVAEHTTCLLVKLGQVAYRLTEDRLAALGLRVRHYSVLQALADNGPMSQLGLGEYLRIDPTTIVQTLDDLEQRALAARTRDPADRRRHVVDLRPKGRTALDQANTLLAALDQELLADVPARSRSALHRQLTTMNTGPTLTTAYEAARDQPVRRPRATG